MKATSRMLAMRLCDETTSLRGAQVHCYAASPALLVGALFAIAHLCSTRAEILIGVLAASAVSLSIVTMGMVLGVLAEVRRR